MSNEDHFDSLGELPLALGSIKGLRGFNVDDKGRLHGVVFPAFTWTRGVNEAVCLRRGRVCGYEGDAGGDHRHEYPQCTGMTPCPRTPGSRREGPNACKCGIYAYQEGSADWLFQSMRGPRRRPAGVIEGFGRVVIGTHGFRCQKARILALYVPPMNEVPAISMQLRHSGSVPFVEARLSWQGREPQPNQFTPDLVSAIAANYGVPIFRNLNVMLRDFPPDPPKTPEEES